MGCGMTKHTESIVHPSTKIQENLVGEDSLKTDQQVKNKSSLQPLLTSNDKKDFMKSNHHVPIPSPRPQHNLKSEILSSGNNNETMLNSNNNHKINPVQISNRKETSSNSVSNYDQDNHSCHQNEKSDFIEIKSTHVNRNKFNECRLQRLQSKKMTSTAYEEADQFNEGLASPFGQRKTLTLTESQIDFFQMLDEKIAQGKDYCSEDERSISSMISRKSKSIGNGSFVRRMKSQHVR